MTPDLAPLSPILLTGATTHTGRRLARRLLECGATLRCFLHTAAHRDRLPDDPRIEVVTGSADNPDDLRRALGSVARAGGAEDSAAAVDSATASSIPREASSTASGE